MREAPLLVINPELDRNASGGAPFAPAPHGTEVGSVIAARFRHPAPLVLSGPDATKGRLRQVRGPLFLHIDAPGYFDATVCTAAPSEALRENPLLRSGIALAGANACTNGKSDGLLTAVEASGLDLYGTRLVVLAGGETGVGETKAGDGVYGMRRALVLAGAETQVTSLWNVDGAATAELMKAYYEALAKGAGLSEAMRQVQLAMLYDGRHEHPYYWASFIVSGDDRALDGKLVDLDLRVPPVGGCTCELGEQGSAGTMPGWLAALTALVLAGRRPAARRGARGCKDKGGARP